MALVAGFVAALLLYGHEVYTSSLDLGWHYALSEYIAHHSHWPQSQDRYLAAMLDYPSLAHIAAASISHVFNIPILMAMFMVTAAGIYFGYVFIALELLHGQRPIWPLSFFLLFLACLWNAAFLFARVKPSVELLYGNWSLTNSERRLAVWGAFYEKVLGLEARFLKRLQSVLSAKSLPGISRITFIPGSFIRNPPR